MLEQKKIDRINALANKAKKELLSQDEKAEQRKLREEFLKDFRARFKQQLANLDVTYVEDVASVEKEKVKN